MGDRAVCGFMAAWLTPALVLLAGLWYAFARSAITGTLYMPRWLEAVGRFFRG